MSTRGSTVRVFYDGGCGLCHRTARFLVARDARARLRYAPLGGPTFLAETAPHERASLPDSLAVRRASGEPLLVRSRAVAAALRELPGAWAGVGAVLAAIPAPLADLGYRAVAAARRSLFAAPNSACPLLPREQLARFDP
jgi:predicted DCC family thiol-disulfide oxidoreductase YuxK